LRSIEGRGEREVKERGGRGGEKGDVLLRRGKSCFRGSGESKRVLRKVERSCAALRHDEQRRTR
jgi:hypothetical protein